VLLVVRWRLRDLAEMVGERGFAFTHEAVREWEARFAPLVADKLRAKRTDQVGRSWHVDEMDIRVGGTWKYLYRAIERDGNLVDSMLSEHRDMDAAKRFFRAALEVAEQAPEKVTTDGHDAYPRATREILGADVTHRCNPYAPVVQRHPWAVVPAGARFAARALRSTPSSSTASCTCHPYVRLLWCA
jgi:transposase-like protein